MLTNSILSFVISLAICAVLTPLAIIVAPKIGAMDIPKDNRRMHTKPIPRFGGLGIYFAVLGALLVFAPKTIQIWGFLLGGGLIVALGIADDLRGLPAKGKLAGQIACAFVATMFDIRFRGIGNIVFPAWLSVILTILWIVGITNTINLIDGLDGLAAGITCISCICVAYTCRLTQRTEAEIVVLAIAGAAVGFLIYNSYPAKIFMGDAGSMFFGFGLATVSLIGENPTKGTTLFASLVPIMILALPIFDTAFAIIRRVANHKPIMQADKGHLHHRIMAMGFGQRRAVLALYCISAVMGIAGILWTLAMRLEALALVLIGACLILIFLGIGIVDKKPTEGQTNPEEEK